MSKSTKRTTPFQRKHALEFGLEIVEFEEKCNMPVVTGVRCLFCVYHGRHVELTSRKRKPTDNIHIFKAPFIKQYYLSHLKQHAETWEEYKELSVDGKKVYFNGKVKRANTMHMYIDTNQDAIHFTISLPIVDVIIKELFYRDEDQILAGIDEIEEEDEEDHHMNMEQIRKKVEKKIALKRNAMKLFKLDEDNEMYTVDIPNSTCFFLAIDYVGCGMSFRQTAAAIRHVKDRLKMQKLGGINDHNVGQYVRALVATNLTKIANLLLHPSVWAFSIAGDGSTHRNSSFFDMRIRICVNGILSNLHLVAIPMFERHTAENIFNLIVRFLDALNGTITIWRAKLMSVSTDGENRMTGCHRGVVTRLEQVAEFPVLRIWCVPHQIDIVIKNAAALPQDGQWIEFYISRRRKIVEHTDAHAHFESPSVKWWTITFAVAPAISEINKTVVQLQNRSLIIIQQKIKIELLKDLLISMFKVKGIIAINDDEADIENKFYVDGNWCVEHQHIIEHIKDQGSFSQECYADLDENNQKDVVLQISQFALFIVAGCDSVKAERDGNNNASELDAPPVVPHELVKLAPRHFISDVLNIYRPRLDRFWSKEEIDKIEVEQRDLIKRYNNDQHIE
ncbi:unnamed protein product [Sphagnum compactum]